MGASGTTWSPHKGGGGPHRFSGLCAFDFRNMRATNDLRGRFPSCHSRQQRHLHRDRHFRDAGAMRANPRLPGGDAVGVVLALDTRARWGGGPAIFIPRHCGAMIVFATVCNNRSEVIINTRYSV
jgi:hypothetical protein